MTSYVRRLRDSFKEDLADHFGLELYADGGNVMDVATTEVATEAVHAGKLLSSEITHSECWNCLCCGKALRSIPLLAIHGIARPMEWLGCVEEPEHA